MKHGPFYLPVAPSVIVVVLCTKSSFPQCQPCYFTVLALLWPRLLPGGPRPTIQATLPLLPLSPPLPRFLAFQEADLAGYPHPAENHVNVNCSEIVK